MRTSFALAAVTTLGLGGLSGSAQAADVGILSATGCTGNAGSTDGSGSVCLEIKGTKLHVDSFKLSKKSNNRAWTDRPIIEIGSGYGYFGTLESASRTQTVTVGATVNQNFPNNTKACGWWEKYPGTKACVTIHN
ncbi:hypothetical protein ABZX85_41045 [Streptomyces sp. NPDC004539]|uniref:hypothetical protein n=1 Tax=Streptomyces sp. NPDC004539 TaxID=3154280 RepID=UPI0033A8EB66